MEEEEKKQKGKDLVLIVDQEFVFVWSISQERARQAKTTARDRLKQR